MTRPHGLVGKAYRLTVAILGVVLALFLMAVTVFGPFWAVVVFIGAPMGLGLCGFIIWICIAQPNSGGG
jgi:hypothetical protein